MAMLDMATREVMVGRWNLPGLLGCPAKASSLVIFAHGTGSSRQSERNRLVASTLNRAGIATLMFDLLHPAEEMAPGRTKIFDIPFLAARLADAVIWSGGTVMGGLPVGLFGASTGAAAALTAAAQLGNTIGAVVCRGGRPDLAGAALEDVRAPTLLIVGGNDHEVLELNRRAAHRLAGLCVVEIIAGASHLFPEPGAMEKVAVLTTEWFDRHLAPLVV
jgi:predicted alpha/beta-hydrolase family hydrolase